MKKKLAALLTIFAMFCSFPSVKADAIKTGDIFEEIATNPSGVIIVPKDNNSEFSVESLGLSKSPEKKIYRDYSSPEGTWFANCDFSDDDYIALFDYDYLQMNGYEDTETCYIISRNSLSDSEMSALLNNSDVDVFYSYHVFRKYITEYENSFITDLLGSYIYKLYKPDEMISNDADSDGKVTAEDALKVLNVITGNSNLTRKERINLGISKCVQSDSEYEYYDLNVNSTLDAEKALEILYQIVGK